MMMGWPACLRLQASKCTSQPSLPSGTMWEMREEGFGMWICFQLGGSACCSEVGRSTISARLSFGRPSRLEPLVLRVPQRPIGLHDCRKPLAEDLDFDRLARHREIGPQHAERDRFVHTMSPAS